MTAEAASIPPPDYAGTDRQNLRLAVVITGGVSLAIWMGGVARELNLLLHHGEPASEPARRVRSRYRALQDLVGVDVTLDVLSGTSAGGINAAILGLANVNGLDIGQLRELWLKEGALSGLLRDPQTPPTPSLLKGDEQLLTGLRTGLQQIAGDVAINPGSPAYGNGEPAPPTDVFITTTFLNGEPSRFVDDYGTLVYDVDHHGLFHFRTEQLRGASAVSRLALAARCTASFPLAFEPGYVPYGRASDPDHPDMAEVSNATRPRFVADGGLLANRPIAAAVRTVFDRPAGQDIRRVLLYVVPTAGAATVAEETVAPLLGTALVKDLAAMTSQTITAELAAIRAHNDAVGVRRDTYRQLAAIGGRVSDGLVSDGIYRDYCYRVSQSVAGALVDEALRQRPTDTVPLAEPQQTGEGGPAGPAASPGCKVSRLHEAVAACLAAALPPTVPGDFDGLGGLGRRGYDAAKVIALDLITRCYQRNPDSAQREGLAGLRHSVHQALQPPGQQALDIVGTVRAALPEGRGLPSAAQLADEWATRQQAHAQLAEGWRQMAAALEDATPLLRSLLDGAEGEPDVMLHYLGDKAGTIASRMARLHIAHTALLPDTRLADQQLELVQVSADTATLLDDRATAGQKLTGLQLHHFGAFYKYSWRANDWMWGRLDGAGWLVHVLLDPRRLRALRNLDKDPAGYRSRLIGQLAGVAGPNGRLGAGRDAAAPLEVEAELDFLRHPSGPLPPSLPETAKWVAAGVQRIILEEELGCVAAQIEADRQAEAAVNEAAERFVAAMRDGSADVTAQLAACRVSDEKLAGEVNSPLYRKTFKQTALLTIAALEGSDKVPTAFKYGLRVLRFELAHTDATMLARAFSLLRRVVRR